MDAITSLALKLTRTPFLRLTKARVLRALRKTEWRDDGLNQKARVRAVYDLSREIMRKRARRFFARYVRPMQPLHERLRSWRERRARAAAREREGPIQFWVAASHAHFQQTTGRQDEHHVHVEVVEDVAEVGAFGDAYAISRRRCGTEHRFRIPRDWLARVHETALALLDGKLTLWAEPRADVLRRGQRIQVFRAIWCRQGPAYSFLTERGFIARLGPHTGHGKQVVAAVRGVLQKAQAMVQDAKHE